MTNGPRVHLTLLIRPSTKGQPDENACPEASLDIFWGLPLASRPPVRLAWNVSSGG